MIGKTADVTKFIEPDAGFTQSGKANEIPSKAALVNHWKPLAAAKTASRPIVKLVKNHANNNWMTKMTPTERQWMCLLRDKINVHLGIQKFRGCSSTIASLLSLRCIYVKQLNKLKCIKSKRLVKRFTLGNNLVKRLT